MLVCSFLGDGVQFVEEQHATAGPRELKRVVQPCGRFAEETRHDSLVADHVEGKHQFCRDRFRHARLAVSRRARQQKSVARLNTVTTQKLGALLLLDQFGHDSLQDRRKFEFMQPTVRYDLMHEIADRCCSVVADGSLSRRRDELREPIGEKMMLVGAFFGDDGLNQHLEAFPIAAAFGLDEV